MTYQQKKYRKFVATAATATLVASAFTPMASAADSSKFTDVTANYKEAVDFVLSKGGKGISETKFGTANNIKRVDAAVLLAKVLELDTDAPNAGFKDVPDRAIKEVNALKAAGITSGKSKTEFGSNDLITRGELAKWIVKGFELTGTSDKNFTDVSGQYKEAVSTLVANKITQGVTDTTFGTNNNAKRGDFAIFLKKANDAKNPVEETAKITTVNAVNGKVTVVLDKEVKAAEAKDFKLTQAIDGKGATSITPTSVKLGEDKKTVELMTPKVNETTTAQNIVVSASYKNGEAKAATAFKVESAEATVDSVKAVNAKTVEVKFNKEIDANTVIDSTNKALKNITVTGNGNPTFTAELSTDKKTLKLHSSSVLTGEYVVNVATDQVKTVDGKYVSSYITKLVVKDEMAPSIAGMEKINPSTVKVNFSEPLKSAGNVSFKYADGTSLGSTNSASFELDASGAFGTITLGSNVTTNKDIVATFVGASDFAGNLLTPNPSTIVVAKGDKDGTAPEVKALNVLAPNQFELQLSEEVTGLDVTDIHVDNNPLVAAEDKVEQSKTDKTKYIVTLKAPQEGVKTISIGAGNTTGIVDNSGEVFKAFSKNVEFKKDVGAPTVSNATLEKDAKDGKEYLMVTFDKSVSLIDSSKDIVLPGSKIKDYLTTNDLKVTIPAGKMVADQDSSTTFKVALADLKEGNASLEKGAAYTLDIPGEIVKNVSNVANESQKGAVKFTRGEDTNTAPKDPQTVDKVEKGTANNKVVVTFGQNVDGESATNPANYSIDGTEVEKAEILNASNKKVVTLTLKDNSNTFTGLRNYSITGVKSAAGGVLQSAAKGTVDLVENVEPTVTKGTIKNNKEIELTFSENMDTSKIGTDFEVFEGTNPTKSESVEKVGTENNKVIITLTNPLSSLSGVKVKAASTLDLTDASGNKLTFKELDATN